MSNENLETESPSSGRRSEPWKCGDEYQYPIPKPNDDPWEVLLRPLFQKDKAQCDGWKDEVQNLLIFAGLFSAVVTAFVIETYKGLQQDPLNTAVELLARIASRLENANTTFNSPLDAFSPTPSSIRVNIFMFMSLVLSLTTVLIGIVALQWLREHQQYAGSLTSEQTLALFNMRSGSLKRWGVPQIFTTLPLLLQLALVLFFAGLLDFLLPLGHQIIIPVAVLVGLTLLFLLMTTILPTLQAFTLQHPYLQLNDTLPSQCAYKSPQARAFRRLVLSSKTSFHICSLLFALMYGISIQLPLLLGRLSNSEPVHRFKEVLMSAFHAVGSLFHSVSVDMPSKSPYNHVAAYIYPTWHKSTWLHFDLAWMSIRDAYFQGTLGQDIIIIHDNGKLADTAIFDATQALWKALKRQLDKQNDAITFAAYHCAQAIALPTTTKLDHDQKFHLLSNLRCRNRFFAKITGYHATTLQGSLFFSNLLVDPSFDLMYDENAFVFLSIVQRGVRPPRVISNHFGEVHFRLLGHLYEQPHPLIRRQDVVDTICTIQPATLYSTDIYRDQDYLFNQQWSLTLDAFFNVVADPGILKTDLENTFHAHSFFQKYIEYFWKELGWQLSRPSPSPSHIHSLTKAVSTITTIADTLHDFLEHPHDNPPDLLFYVVAHYAQCLTYYVAVGGLQPQSKELKHAARCRLIPILRKYREARILRTVGTDTSVPDFVQLEKRLLGGYYYSDFFKRRGRHWATFSDPWWRFLFSSTSGSETDLPVD